MKTKRLLLFSLVLISAFLLSGCGKKTGDGVGGGTGGNMAKVAKGDVGNDVCSFFDADFMYSAMGKPIVRMEYSPLRDHSYCQYFTSYQEDFYKMPDGRVSPGGEWVSLGTDNLNVDRQKKAMEFLGRTITTDSRIKMENFLATQEDGNINSIYLVINPNRFLSVDRSSGAVLTNEEDILLAVKIAEKIQGKISFDLKKNPTAVKAETPGVTTAPTLGADKGKQEETARNFINFLSEKKIDEAIAMMDANENTKQGWGVNFNTIKSLKIKKVEAVYEEEWTAEREIYKFTLEVSVTPEGEGYGWENGENFRWVSVQKSSGVWQIHELANNP